ncbi:hypothetical protein [Bacteroides sp. OF04-15BH]|uniref:hypothetical protein n=1 Tax=Bacteroides sp. OF04-15BH TaxID=2292281 RepID=UPI000E4A8471|nr:hypothetical protein [Bacteroides sp. OF04-15BH]RHP65411.1 hypothetical protein DXA74_06455 [Bacteroides sp. OF04-15BH]
MEHSELFLLLPKYEDVEEQPEYIKSTNIMTENEFLKVINKIDEICMLISNENYKGYYDAENVSAFLYPAKTLKKSYPNTITRMRMVMNKWGENWRTQKVQKDTVKYMYYCIPIKDDTLCEMTERKFVSKDESTFLLINYDAFSCASETIIIKRNQDEVKLNVRNADIKNISKWYETNRKPQRIFNLNPKHGENGKGAHPGNKGEKVSVLMCNKEEAKNMLLKAIGTDLRVLYFFDQVHNQFIEFKRESENTYHGFHLDAIDEKRVPEDIKAMINKLI